MNAREFLELAEELIAGPSEGHWRTAVSRAYYYAFHVARSLMENAGFRVPESDAAHAYLSMRFPTQGIQRSTTPGAGWRTVGAPETGRTTESVFRLTS